MERSNLKSFVLELLRQCGGVALQSFRADMGVENKAGEHGYDPVTVADRAIETLIRGAIRGEYPDHGIIGEEFSDHQPEARWLWYIDPIDGTRAFMSGSPLWGTLIGLVDDGVPVLGAMGQPFLNEIYIAVHGTGELIAGGQSTILKARSTVSLDRAILYTTDPTLFPDGESQQDFQRVAGRVQLVRYGGDCYSYAMLAAGLIDLVIEAGLNAYDIVPLIPLLESAGAVVTDWHGNKSLQGGHVIAAANPTLHAQALSVLGT